MMFYGNEKRKDLMENRDPGTSKGTGGGGSGSLSSVRVVVLSRTI